MRCDQPAQLARRTLLAGGAALAVFGVSACNDNGSGGSTATPRTTPRSTPSGSASNGASPSASPKPTVKASTNLDAVTVKGAFGKKPTVTVKAPWTIDKTRTKVLSSSKSRAIPDGGTATVNYFGVNARTGKRFDDSWSAGQPATFSLAQVIPGFAKGLKGQRVGSRVLIAMPGTDGYDSSGGNSDAGIEVGDTLLFVVDIIGAQLPGPEGTKVTPAKGLPTVTDAKGVPSITVPKTDPPKKLVVQPLIEGEGTKIAKTDQVTADYVGVNWADGKTVFSTYDSAADTTAVDDTIKGLTQALVGKRVGSRVLVIVPPSLGYPKGNASPKVDKGTTLVFVVDLLYAVTAQ